MKLHLCLREALRKSPHDEKRLSSGELNPEVAEYVERRFSIEVLAGATPVFGGVSRAFLNG